MPGLVCRNPGFQEAPDKPEVSDKVQELVPCTFVGEAQAYITQISVVLYLEDRYIEQLGHVLQLLLGDGVLDYYHGIVHVAALYQIVLEKIFYLMEENECPAYPDLFRIDYGRIPVGCLNADDS